MRGENRLSTLGADVTTVLKKKVAKKGTSYKAQAQEVLGEKVHVRALTARRR